MQLPSEQAKSYCSAYLYNLLLLRRLNKILQDLSSDMLPLRGFRHDSESAIRAARTQLFTRHFITFAQ